MERIIKLIIHGQICSDVFNIIQFPSESVLESPFARTILSSVFFSKSGVNIVVPSACPLPPLPALTHW